MDNRQKLESVLSRLNKSDNAFLGRVMQNMTIKLAPYIPTAGVMFNPKNKNYEMVINPEFTNKLTDVEFTGVLLHEVGHIIHKHVFFDVEKLQYNRQMLNVAQDLVINQNIKGLPKMCMFIENFKDKKGTPFKAKQATEYYYDLLMDDAEMKIPEGDEGDESGEGGGKGEKWVNAKDHFAPKEYVFDDHSWNEANGESSENAKEQMEAARDLIKRTMQKTGFDYSTIPESVREMLQEIDSQIQRLDYKRLLMNAVKKSLPSPDRKKTWKRLNKRYGEYARGTVCAESPKIHVIMDTSGSISIEVANDFLAIANNFLTSGSVDRADISLFHTRMYHTEKIKKNFQLDRSVIESGGTDLTNALEETLSKRPDLVICLTDGYFDFPKIDPKKLPKNMVFVIDDQGTVDHPLKAYGTTVKCSK